MVVFLWIWKILGPIISFLGAIYFLSYVDASVVHPIGLSTTCIIGGVCAVIGIILGFTGWAEDVPPRLFWVRSRMELLDSKIGYALTFGVQFFLLPAFICLIIAVIAEI